MPVNRMFRGKRVKRTKREGARIRVIYDNGKGKPGQSEVVPMADYEKEVSREYTAPTS